MHKLPLVDNYWKESFIFSNKIPSLINKNFFEPLCYGMRINIQDTDLLPNEHLSEEIENKKIDV